LIKKVALTLSLIAFLLPAHRTTAHPAKHQHFKITQDKDKKLQNTLNNIIYKMHLDKIVKSNRLAITIVDITDPKPRMAGVNGNEMIYAASLPKIAILLAAFEKIESGGLSIHEVKPLLIKMIRNSSNSAATKVMNMVGEGYVNEVLTSNKYRLYDKNLNGGLWVGKKYDKEKAFRRDPLHNISHGATTFQIARFFNMLSKGELVSRKASKEMLAILSHPGIKHKFVKGLDGSGAVIFRKSGTWRKFHADGAIIKHSGKVYIAAAIIEDDNGGAILTKLIKKIDSAILNDKS